MGKQKESSSRQLKKAVERGLSLCNGGVECFANHPIKKGDLIFLSKRWKEETKKERWSYIPIAKKKRAPKDESDAF